MKPLNPIEYRKIIEFLKQDSIPPEQAVFEIKKSEYDYLRTGDNFYTPEQLDSYQLRHRKTFYNNRNPKVLIELPEKIPFDLIQELIELSETLHYENYYALNFAIPSKESISKIHNIFSRYREDLYCFFFVKCFSGDMVMPHSDPVRDAGVYIPLCRPEESYMPLEIYEDENVNAIGKDDVGSAFIWNPKYWHAVFNQKATTPRINLQMNTTIPYKDFVEKYGLSKD